MIGIVKIKIYEMIKEEKIVSLIIENFDYNC